MRPTRGPETLSLATSGPRVHFLEPLLSKAALSQGLYSDLHTGRMPHWDWCSHILDIRPWKIGITGGKRGIVIRSALCIAIIHVRSKENATRQQPFHRMIRYAATSTAKLVII